MRSWWRKEIHSVLQYRVKLSVHYHQRAYQNSFSQNGLCLGRSTTALHGTRVEGPLVACEAWLLNFARHQETRSWSISTLKITDVTKPAPYPPTDNNGHLGVTHRLIFTGAPLQQHQHKTSEASLMYLMLMYFR